MKTGDLALFTIAIYDWTKLQKYVFHQAFERADWEW